MGLHRLFLMGIAVWVTTATSDAAIQYQYVADVSTLSLLPGEAGSVSIFLQESLTSGSTTFLGAPYQSGKSIGLFSAGFSISRTGTVSDGGAVITDAIDQTGFNSTFRNGLGFASPAQPTVSFSGQQTVSFISSYGAQPTNFDANTYRVLLGTIYFQGGTAASTFRVSNYSASSLNTLTFADLSGTSGSTHRLNLDDTTPASANNPSFFGARNVSFSIDISTAAAVPEPSTFIFGSLAIVGFVYRLRRGHSRR